MQLIIGILLSLSGSRADDKVVLISPDGQTRIESPYRKDQAAKLIRVQTGEVLFTFPAKLKSFAYHPDSQQVAAMPSLHNLGTKLANGYSTQAAPVTILDLRTWLSKDIHFGKEILPRGDAVKNGGWPILKWSADGKYLSIDIEHGDSIGIVLDLNSQKIKIVFGRVSGRVQAESKLPEDVRWTFYAPISKRDWLDFEGRPVIDMAWNPSHPSVLAVSYYGGKVVLFDLDQLEGEPKNARVDISRLIKRETEDKSVKGYEVAYHSLQWSQNGRYLIALRSPSFVAWQERKAVIAVFDTYTASVVAETTVVDEFPDSFRAVRLKLSVLDDGKVSVQDREGTEIRLLTLPNYGGEKQNICAVSLSKLGFIERLLQRHLYRF